MNIIEFLGHQDKVYDDMRSLERDRTRTKGIEPDPRLISRNGGFFLSFVHEPRITARASAISVRIGACVPAISYTTEELHTTAGSIVDSIQDHFYFDREMPVHKEWLDAVLHVAYEVTSVVGADPCLIAFTDPFMIVPTGVVAPGQPNQGFFEVIHAVERVSKEYGVKFRLPWGAHMTLNRFTERKSVTEAQKLFDLLGRERPLGVSRIIGISAGYTLRKRTERGVTNLKDTRGPFYTEKFFPFT